MAQPASSVVDNYTLASDQTVAGGASFRLDKMLIANNTAAPVLVLFRDAADTVTKIAVVADAYATVTPQVEGMMDAGCVIKAVSANVYVTLCRSQAGA